MTEQAISSPSLVVRGSGVVVRRSWSSALCSAGSTERPTAETGQHLLVVNPCVCTHGRWDGIP